MIIFRIFLYLVCILSISWSILVFAGPAVIKRVIFKYTDGAIITSDIEVSPALDITIGRLDFKIASIGSEQPISGFSRSTEISWSFWDNQPFLTVDIGPTVIKDILTAENVKLNTSSYHELVWQDLFFVSEVVGLDVSSMGEFVEVNLQGFYDHRSSQLKNILYEAKDPILQGRLPALSLGHIEGAIDKIFLNGKLDEQIVSGSFSAEKLLLGELELQVKDISGDFRLAEGGGNFELELLRLELEQLGSSISRVGIDGNYDTEGSIKNLHIDIKNGTLVDGSPNFSYLAVNLLNRDGPDFEFEFDGVVDEFEIHSADSFIGVLPTNNLKGVFQIGGERSDTVSVTSKLNFNSPTRPEIYGSAKLGLNLEPAADFMQCLSQECDASDFYFDYIINFDDEWAKGQSTCQVKPCNFEVIKHYLLTSNTTKIITKLNQVGILTPLSSLYLFGVLSAGESIDEGHQLKF